MLITTYKHLAKCMSNNILIGPLVIRAARAHGSPVRTGRTHGPDGEKSLHCFFCASRTSGPTARLRTELNRK